MSSPDARFGADYGSRRAAAAEAMGARAAGAARASIGDSLNAVFACARQALADFVELASLELKRAGGTLVSMLVWGVVAVLMGATAWFGLMVAIVLGLIALNVPEAAAVLIVVAINIIGAGAIGYWCVSASKALAMTATRRQLRIAAAEASEVNVT